MSTVLTNGIIIPDNGSRNWGGDLANNWNILDVNVGYMNDVKTKVTTLENNVAENTANIQINTSNISALQTSKQDVIEDLETIRDGASAGATAVQPSELSNYYTKTEMDTALTSKANDSDVVHKSGNETIGGVKDFNGVFLGEQRGVIRIGDNGDATLQTDYYPNGIRQFALTHKSLRTDTWIGLNMKTSLTDDVIVCQPKFQALDSVLVHSGTDPDHKSTHIYEGLIEMSAPEFCYIDFKHANSQDYLGRIGLSPTNSLYLETINDAPIIANGKNIVRSVNGVNADSNGNVNIQGFSNRTFAYAYNTTSVIDNIHVGSVLTNGGKVVSFVVPININGSPTIEFTRLRLRSNGYYLFGSTGNSEVTTSYTFTTTVIFGGLNVVINFSNTDPNAINNSCIVSEIALKLTY